MCQAAIAKPLLAAGLSHNKNKIMSMKKAALMLGLAATMMDYTNPYADLPEMRYSGSKPSRKSPLTKKQKKARAASKRAKQARKRGR